MLHVLTLINLFLHLMLKKLACLAQFDRDDFKSTKLVMLETQLATHIKDTKSEDESLYVKSITGLTKKMVLP